MDLLIRFGAIVLSAGLIAGSPARVGNAATVASDAAVKAAFLFNFAKFTEWPSLAAGTPIVACVAGDEDIGAELTNTVRGQTIGGHTITVRKPQDSSFWMECQLLFIGDGESRHFAATGPPFKAQPILTVSDNKGFSQIGGIIELYVDQGRLRFLINLDAAERAKLRLSARLLSLAKVVHDGQ
jgi:hypothetical protein